MRKLLVIAGGIVIVTTVLASGIYSVWWLTGGLEAFLDKHLGTLFLTAFVLMFGFCWGLRSGSRQPRESNADCPYCGGRCYLTSRAYGKNDYPSLLLWSEKEWRDGLPASRQPGSPQR